MPSRNIIKEYAPDSYYHVYARGVSKQKIFLEAKDYHYFYSMLRGPSSKEKGQRKITAEGLRRALHKLAI